MGDGISRGLTIDLNTMASIINTIIFAAALMVASKYIEKTRGGKKETVLFIQWELTHIIFRFLHRGSLFSFCCSVFLFHE